MTWIRNETLCKRVKLNPHAINIKSNCDVFKKNALKSLKKISFFDI